MCVKTVFSFCKSWCLTHTLIHTGHIYVNTMKSGFMFLGVEWLNMLLCPLELCWSLHHQIEAICPLPSPPHMRVWGRSDLLECDCTQERKAGEAQNSPTWLLTYCGGGGVSRPRR